MGREIKRVVLDFDWPIGVIWKGFVNPYRGMKCRPCGGSGRNPEVKRLSDSWYGNGFATGWHRDITQDEVDALVAAGRLHDFTSVFIPGTGWQRDKSKPHPTAAKVNAWSRQGMGHDGINQMICVEIRAKRLGIWGEDGNCFLCKGEGDIFPTEEFRKLHNEWERIKPPAGEGWQVWETVSEGSAVTPVLPTKEALIDYLVANGDSWDQQRGAGGWSRDAAESFVEHGWAPSLVVELSSTGTRMIAARGDV